MRRTWRRSAAPERAEPAPPVVPARDVDDLPGFFAAPPGSPPALTPAPSPAPRAAAGAAEPADNPAAPPGPGRRRPRVLVAVLLAVVALVVVAALVVAGIAAGRDDTDRPDRAADTDGRSATPTAAQATSRSAAPLTAAAAGDLADVDVAPGDDGFTAALTSTGVVLEPQAVGVTVAYPQLSVSSDGAQAVAHLDLTVWNCLADAAPADPVAADCRRSLAEYADLGSPDLQVTRTADGFRLSGTVATYTRPNGSAPAYTGRSYPLDVEVQESVDGLTGTLALGTGRATVVPPGELVG